MDDPFFNRSAKWITPSSLHTGSGSSEGAEAGGGVEGVGTGGSGAWPPSGGKGARPKMRSDPGPGGAAGGGVGDGGTAQEGPGGLILSSP